MKIVKFVLILAIIFLFNFNAVELISAEERIVIENCQELQEIGSSEKHLDGNYVLEEDLDCDSVENFEPIGFESSFSGTFDGNGYKIKNITIDMQSKQSNKKVALFSEMNSQGEILNLGIKNPNIKGGEETAGLVSYNSGIIQNCYLEGGVIKGSDYTGGLVATNWNGLILNSYSDTTVNGNDYVGGFVAWNDGGIIEDSYSTGDVDGGEKVGGFVGKNDSGDIIKSYAEGDVFGSGSQVGGFVGRNLESFIEKSYAEGDVKGGYWGVGGFVGFNDNDGSVKTSYATGDVDWVDNSSEGEGAIGGFAGYSLESIKDSYATGDVGRNSPDESDKLFIGGFVGQIDGGEVKDSYATGDVSGSNSEESQVGGFAGYLFNGSVENSYATGDVVATEGVGGIFIGKNDSVIENSFAYQSGSQNCIGAGDKSGCTLVEDIESFYNYQDGPLDDLYGEWDFNSSWSDSNLGRRYPNLLWTESSRRSGRAVKGATTSRSNQRPISWYKNPLFREEAERMLKNLQAMQSDIGLIQEEINSIIKIAEELNGKSEK